MVPRPATAQLLGVAAGADTLPKELFAAALEAPNSITFDFGEIQEGATLLLMLYFVETSPGTAPALPAAPGFLGTSRVRHMHSGRCSFQLPV